MIKHPAVCIILLFRSSAAAVGVEETMLANDGDLYDPTAAD